MRIALFTETFLPHIDGVVTRLIHTLEALRDAGDKVLVVAPRARGLPAEFAGAQIIGSPSVPLPVYRSFHLGLPIALGLDATLTTFAPDIVHTVNPVMLGLAGFSYTKRHHVPLVASYHTQLASYARRYRVDVFEPAIWWYVRGLHNRAQLNLCTSRPVLEQLRERGFKRVELWGPGVDAQLFHPRRRSPAWRERLSNGNPDAVLLLYVGRLASEKSLESLAPALAQLQECHLALVGEGPAENSLRQAFAGLSVTFIGPLHGEELAAAYASADIFAFPSATETLGLAAIEAMAAGLPVVGARRGGLLDSVVDGETGLLFDPDTPGDLKRALHRLAREGEARHEMGRRGRERAEGWSWASSAAGLREQYRAVLERATSLDGTACS